MAGNGRFPGPTGFSSLPVPRLAAQAVVALLAAPPSGSTGGAGKSSRIAPLPPVSNGAAPLFDVSKRYARLPEAERKKEDDERFHKWIEERTRQQIRDALRNNGSPTPSAPAPPQPLPPGATPPSSPAAPPSSDDPQAPFLNAGYGSQANLGLDAGGSQFEANLRYFGYLKGDQGGLFQINPRFGVLGTGRQYRLALGFAGATSIVAPGAGGAPQGGGLVSGTAYLQPPQDTGLGASLSVLGNLGGGAPPNPGAVANLIYTRKTDLDEMDFTGVASFNRYGSVYGNSVVNPFSVGGVYGYSRSLGRLTLGGEAGLFYTRTLFTTNPDDRSGSSYLGILGFGITYTQGAGAYGLWVNGTREFSSMDGRAPNGVIITLSVGGAKPPAKKP